MIEDSDYRSLSVLTIALMAGIVFFCLTGIIIHFTVGPVMPGSALWKWFFCIWLLASAAGIILVRTRFSFKINALQQSGCSDREKLVKFRTILITHIALCEIFAMTSIACFILFGQWVFLIVVGMSLVEIAKKFPDRSKVDNIITAV